jgi:hypothetical protein
MSEYAEINVNPSQPTWLPVATVATLLHLVRAAFAALQAGMPAEAACLKARKAAGSATACNNTPTRWMLCSWCASRYNELSNPGKQHYK